jgi:hypothetical protein
LRSDADLNFQRFPLRKQRYPLITPARTSLLPLALQAALDLNVPKDEVRRAIYWGLVVPECAIGIELTIAAIATTAEMQIFPN